MKEVFISYHTDSSREYVEQISVALEGAGISCWYAPRNVTGDYASSILKAINECKVFLLILNSNSGKSEHVLNEINLAFDRLAKHEDIELLPFRIDECSLKDAILYYLGRIHIMDGGIPPELLRIKELIGRIQDILGKEPQRTACITEQETGKRKEYRMIGSMIYADSSFVGRAEELEDMHQQLSGRNNKLFLVGMGGIGKSELTKAYCDIYRDDYDVILWLSFSESLQKTVINDFEFPIEGIERSQYLDDSDEDYFERKITVLKGIADRRILIVLDNFDVMEDKDLEFFCSGSYSVLFTTRCHSLCKKWPQMSVTEMKKQEDLLALFQTEYKRNIDDCMEAVNQLLQLLNGHPLSIRLVASAMQSRRISPEKMLTILTSKTAALKEQNEKAADIIAGRLRQVFYISELTPQEQHLLKNLALLPLQGIKVETLYDWCDLDDFDVLDGLIEKSWVISKPGPDEVHLHPLIADLMIEQLKKDFYSCTKLLDTLKKKQEVWVGLKYSERKLVAACFASVWERLPVEHPQKWDVMWGRARVIFESSLYEQGVRLFEELLDHTEDMELRLMVYNKISQGYCLSGDMEKSIEVAMKYLEEVDKIPEELLSKNIPVWKKELYIRIAQSNQYLGNYDEAEKYSRMSLEGEVKFYHSSPLNSLGWSELHLAKILFLKNTEKDLEESQSYFEHSLQLFEEENDKLSPAYCYNTMSQIYMGRGEYEEAFRYIQLSTEILLEHLGQMHVDIGVNAVHEGNIYRTMGNEEEAMRCYAKAREIFQAVSNRKCEKVLEQIVAGKDVGYVD